MILALTLCLLALVVTDCHLRYKANLLSAQDFEFHFSLGHVKPKYCMTHTKLYRTSKCDECTAKQ